MLADRIFLVGAAASGSALASSIDILETIREPAMARFADHWWT